MTHVQARRTTFKTLGGERIRQMVFDCPWCGRQHFHSDEYGHRISHCHAPGAPREYVLVPALEAHLEEDA